MIIDPPLEGERSFSLSAGSPRHSHQAQHDYRVEARARNFLRESGTVWPSVVECDIRMSAELGMSCQEMEAKHPS